MNFAIKMVLCCVVLQAQAETVMRFQAHISPEAARVGDVLSIAPDKKHWAKIKLDSQPRHGDKIHEAQIIAWLQRKVGTFSFQWKGKHTAVVQQVTQTKAQDILNKAQVALAEDLKKQGYENVVLSSKTKLKDSNIALDDFKVQLPKEFPIAKRVCVYLSPKSTLSSLSKLSPSSTSRGLSAGSSSDATSLDAADKPRHVGGGERDKSRHVGSAVWFSVKAYQSVYVATHRMKSHTLVQKKDFILKKINIAGLKNPPIKQLSQTVWLNKSINKNQILTQEDVGTQPEVMQGQKVKVKVQQSGISIVVDALAQDDGSIGQEIQMKNPRNNKYFTARVNGKGQAEVVA